MKKIYIRNSEVRDFEDKIIELYDCREGVVMDSFTGVLEGGVEFVALDTFETCWTSGLTVYTGTTEELSEVWDNFTNEYDSEMEV